MSKHIASKHRTFEIIDQFQLHAKKGYGQNFIIDPSIVMKIAQSAQLTPDTLVIEIGPGIGALTEQLAQLAKHVLAFEIDKTLIPVLEHTLSDYQNVTIINEDFLTIDLNDYLAEAISQQQPIVVCANLPYYITTPILFKIFESNTPISYITVMVQKEVADRFGAKVNTKDYNALTVITNYQYDVSLVMKIPRMIFSPQPNVDSAVIQFKTKPYQSEGKQRLFTMIKACFKHRRKTIFNNYKEYLQDSALAEYNLSRAGINLQTRAEALTLSQFIRLYEVENET
jgi:16S rRNA (adenine1518-N6/adenine1519-N6)-dimethyltransferase